MGPNIESGMILGIAITVIINIGVIFSFFRAIVQRKPMDAIMCFCMLLFLAFLDCSLYFGGSAFNSAETQYELYEAGHYYLSSHGNYTEVSLQIYNFMKVSEVVGTVAFAFAFLTAIIRNKMETGKFFGR